jgi:pimeloyl-ACP methyl ester carboxylesterase
VTTGVTAAMMAAEPSDLFVRLHDPDDAYPFGAGVTMAVTLWMPPSAVRRDTLLFCYPGGGYSRTYFDYTIPGREDYSMARFLAAAGFVVACCDHLGTGESSLPEPASLSWDVLAKANDLVVRKLVASLERGSLGDGIEPLPVSAIIGLGHSMGGSLVVIQQAQHRTFDAIVTMGTPIKRVVIPFGGAELQEIPTNPLPAGVPDGYLYAGPRPQMLHYAFYLDDVPAEVMEADRSTETTIPPSAQEMFEPGILRAYAEAVTVPVLLVFGERDISPVPHAEVEGYSGTRDVGLYVLGGSAHCHNLSSSRKDLWRRLISWIGATT